MNKALYFMYCMRFPKIAFIYLYILRIILTHSVIDSLTHYSQPKLLDHPVILWCQPVMGPDGLHNIPTLDAVLRLPAPVMYLPMLLSPYDGLTSYKEHQARDSARAGGMCHQIIRLFLSTFLSNTASLHPSV